SISVPVISALGADFESTHKRVNNPAAVKNFYLPYQFKAPMGSPTMKKWEEMFVKFLQKSELPENGVPTNFYYFGLPPAIATVVNFGHGDLVMGGAFAVYAFVVYLRLPYLAGALIALAVLFGVGVAIHQGLMRRIMTGPHLAIAMMALAVGYALRRGARILWGREVLPFPRIFPDRAWAIGDVVVTSDNVIVSGTVLGLMVV